MDYELYQYFNLSLWKQIQPYGADFYVELELYKSYLQEIQAYCDPLIMQIYANRSALNALVDILDKVKPLEFEESDYGSEFEIDVVWCVLTRINIMEFYNIMRVQEFPTLCDFMVPNADEINPDQFTLTDNSQEQSVRMWKGFCARKKRNDLVPLEALAGSLFWWVRNSN